MKISNHSGSRRVLSAFALLLACCCQAEERNLQIDTALRGTTISGYVNTSTHWNAGSEVQVVPEPSTLALLAVGGVVMGFIFRRQRKS